MADIFFSYKREDQAKIQPLVRLLEDEGYVVWWDIDLKAGERFDDVIGKELETSSCVIVGWSKSSVGANWVKDEAAFGRDRNKLIPLSLDGVDPPLGFRQFHTANLKGWRGESGDPRIASLLGSIDQICGPGVRRRRQRRRAETAIDPIAVTLKNRAEAKPDQPSIVSAWFRRGVDAALFVLHRKLLWIPIAIALAIVELVLMSGRHDSSVNPPISSGVPSFKCPHGMRANAGGTGCEVVMCVGRTQLNWAGNGCEPICPSGSRLNAERNGCDTVVCERGLRLNLAGNGCEPLCVYGTRLNTTGNTCEVIVCSFGKQLNRTGDACD